MTEGPTEHRINLRLPAEVFEAIEKLRHEGNGKLSYNAWVERAIEEKIQRDRVREALVPRPGEGQRTFYEFFAGGGMARAGLGANWFCLFANDIDRRISLTVRPDELVGLIEARVSDLVLP